MIEKQILECMVTNYESVLISFMNCKENLQFIANSDFVNTH